MKVEYNLMVMAAHVRPENVPDVKIVELLKRGVDWNQFVEAVTHHRVAPLVWRNLKRIDSAVLPPSVLQRLHDEYHTNALNSLQLSATLLKLVAHFNERRVNVVPFKGLCFAALAYDDITLRSSGDIDLLVAQSDLNSAKQLLIEHGFREGYGLTEWQQNAAIRTVGQLTFVDDQGIVVDLHCRILPTSFQFPFDVQSAIARQVPVSIGGRTVTTFCAEDMLLIMAAHGGRDLWNSLRKIVDVAALLESAETLDWDRVQKLASDCRSKRMLLLALKLAHDLFDPKVPDSMLSAIHDDPTVATLADSIHNRLRSSDPDFGSGAESIGFHLQVRERRTDAVRYGLGLALTPTVADWRMWVLPQGFGWFYYFLRPIRLMTRSIRNAIRNPNHEAPAKLSSASNLQAGSQSGILSESS